MNANRKITDGIYHRPDGCERVETLAMHKEPFGHFFPLPVAGTDIVGAGVPEHVVERLCFWDTTANHRQLSFVVDDRRIEWI
jgi:hypothetical protein